MGTAVGLAWPAAFTRAACGGCRCEFIEKLHCLSCGPGTARALVTERCCAAVLRSVPCAGPEGAAGLARGAILPEGPAVLRPSKGAAALWCSRGVPQRRTGLGCAASAALCTRGPCAPQAETWRVIAGLPWVIKPIYGFITDTVPVFGMRRRPYLVGCGLVGAPLPPSAPT